MLPSLLLMAVLIYEWTQEQENRLLFEAAGCMFISLICGVFIVAKSSEGDERRTGEFNKPKRPTGEMSKPTKGTGEHSRVKPAAEAAQGAATATQDSTEAPISTEPLRSVNYHASEVARPAAEPAVVQNDPVVIEMPPADEPIDLPEPEPQALPKPSKPKPEWSAGARAAERIAAKKAAQSSEPQTIALGASAPEPVALPAGPVLPDGPVLSFGFEEEPPSPSPKPKPKPVPLAPATPVAPAAPAASVAPAASSSSSDTAEGGGRCLSDELYPDPRNRRASQPAPEPIALGAPAPASASISADDLLSALDGPEAELTQPSKEALPPGPELGDLFSGLEAPAYNDPPTLKVEIAVKGPEQAKNRSDLKVEFQVKGAEAEPRAQNPVMEQVVANLEAKVARIEAVAAKLEAREDSLHGMKLDPNKVDDGKNSLHGERKLGTLGTRELVRPLPDLKTVGEWLEYAVHLEQSSNFDDAIKCYDKVSALEASNFVAWYKKGSLLRQKGSFDDAIYCLNYALRVDTSHSGAMTEKGLCLFHLGRHEQALTWFDKALAKTTDLPAALNAKARCLSTMGKHKDAVAILDKLVKLEPTNAGYKKARDEAASKVK